jgi:hypothetical protein
MVESDRIEEKSSESNTQVPAQDVTLKDVRKLNQNDRAAQDKVNEEFGGLEIGDKRRDSKLPSGGSKSPDTPAERAEERAEGVADQYGADVSAKEKNGKMEYSFSYTDQDGKQHEILSTDNTNYEQELKDLQAKQIAETEQRYNVDISENGDTHKFGDDNHRKEYELRTPGFNEIATINQALSKSEPANLTNDGKPLKIAYPKEKTSDNPAYYQHDEQIIVMEPTNNPENVEGNANVLRHELAHNGDYQTRERGSKSEEKYYNQLGWERTEKGAWAMRTKDGKLYHQDYDDPRGTWVRVNEEGNEVDKNGNEHHWYRNNVERDTLTNDEMREAAEVRPTTTYFPSPGEMHADAMRDYRGGEEGRRQLYQNSPELYYLAKEGDQQEIDHAYPPIDGQSQLIRGTDGSLIENSPTNRREIALHENQIMSGAPVRDYRAGEYGRQHLYQNSPDLYFVAKEADQQEINRTHSPTANGEPTYIRAVDGSVVPNTPQNRYAIGLFETRMMGILPSQVA